MEQLLTYLPYLPLVLVHPQHINRLVAHCFENIHLHHGNDDHQKRRHQKEHQQTDPVPGGTFSSWQNNMAFILGNEASSDGLWEGTIRMAAIHRRALSDEQRDRIATHLEFRARLPAA